MTRLDTAPTTAPPRRGVLLRILPIGLYAGRPGVVLERSLRVYRRAWLVIVSGFFEPLFYLLSFGTGLSRLVGGGVTGPDGHPLTYAQYIAPALLATSAMNGAITDSMMNVFSKLKFAKLYDSMLASSLGVLDVALGEMGWAMLRGGLYGVGFVLLMLVMGLLISPWAVLLVPAALVVGFGFAAIGMAMTTYLRSWQDLQIVTLVIMPMFLFSGTFYSLSTYPAWLRVLVECLPLTQAVSALRDLAVGNIHAGLLWHLLYFLVMTVIGLRITARRLSALLLT
jgi:lipooligosaccharide transport system permease protein